MRKFLLYFLLIAFILAVGTFAYGFYNGAKIRGFAAAVAAVRAEHDLAPQVERIQKDFASGGEKSVTQIRDESAQFAETLEKITKESRAAKNEIEDLSAPGPAAEAKQLATGYYARIEKQSASLEGIIAFMGQIIDVAAAFGSVGESTTLDEMKSVIAQAKEKGEAINTDSLPPELEPKAESLKNAFATFIIKMEETAQLRSENSAELDASYNDFSEKENEFFSAAKDHIYGMENIDIINERLAGDLAKLQKIYFSLR